MIKTIDEENRLFYTCQNISRQKDYWLIDSGCNNHITKCSHAFRKIDTLVKVPIKIGNGATVKSEGKDTIIVHIKKDTRLIKNVLYVPDLNQILLSVPQMIQNEYSL